MARVRQVRLAGRETAKKRAPRKLDPKADFNEPTKKNPEEPEQLVAEELQTEPAEMPSRIVNGFMAVNFVRPHFEIEKDNRSVALEFSLELTNDHRSLLPAKILNEWEHIEEGTCRLSEVIGVGTQRFDLRLAPDDEESDLEQDSPVQKIRLQVIEDKGSGASKDIIRLSFRMLCDLTPVVEKFACRNFGGVIWLKMDQIQSELL
jgi:hypothetical protein